MNRTIAQNPRCIALVLLCALAGCTSATATGKAAAGPTTMIKDDEAPDPAHDARADAEQTPGTASTCTVRQAPRTFVALDDMDNFEVTAREAERVLAAVKLGLCQLDPTQDKDGTLRAALSGGVVEITAIRFEDAGAVLDVQTVPADGSKPSALETHWLVRAARTADEWQIASAVRKSAPPKKAKRHR